MKTMRHLLAVLVLITASQANGGEFEDLLAKANDGDAGAQFTIGRKYSQGDGVSRDPAEAMKWLEKSATQGNADAQLGLGALLIGGRGVPKNSVEAAKWFQLAAQQGRAAAQIQMARMYLAGAGVLKDDVQASMWARLALAQGNYQARKINELLNSRMTALQSAQAGKLASEFVAKQAADDADRGIPRTAPPLE